MLWYSACSTGANPWFNRNSLFLTSYFSFGFRWTCPSLLRKQCKCLRSRVKELHFITAGMHIESVVRGPCSPKKISPCVISPPLHHLYFVNLCNCYGSGCVYSCSSSSVPYCQDSSSDHWVQSTKHVPLFLHPLPSLLGESPFPLERWQRWWPSARALLGWFPKCGSAQR